MRSPLLLCVGSQLAVSLVVVSLLWVFLGTQLAHSYLFGAAVFLISNAYFVYYAFRYGYQVSARGDREGRQEDQRVSEQKAKETYTALLVARSFNKGEFGKLVLSALGFALIFKSAADMNIFVVFAGFFSMIVVHMLLAMQVARSMSQPGQP